MSADRDKKNRRNYYRLLHVQPDAPIEVIKASYRTLMRTLRHHPDLGGDDWNAVLINEAYAVLSSTEARELYDREGGNLEKTVGPVARTSSEAAPEEAASEIVTFEQTDSGDSRICAFCRTMNPGSREATDATCGGCGGPLRLVDLTTGRPTTRETRRIEHQTDIVYQVDPSGPSSAPSRVVDLSPTGLQFLSERRLQLGCVIKIDSPTLSAVARVTRSSEKDTSGLFATGVRFLTLKLGRPRGTFVSECA